MKIHSCPRCNNSEVGIQIRKCEKCNTVYCANCNGGGFSAAEICPAPHCGHFNYEYIAIIEEKEIKAEVTINKKQHQESQQALKEVQQGIARGNELTEVLIQKEEESVRREDIQREYANDFFGYKNTLQSISLITDEAVKAHFVKSRMDSLLSGCSDAQYNSNDFHLKKDYDLLINFGQRLKRETDYSIDTGIFERYEQLQDYITSLYNDKNSLGSVSSLFPALLGTIGKGFLISLVSTLIFGAILEKMIPALDGSKLFENGLFLGIWALIIYRKVHVENERNNAIKIFEEEIVISQQQLGTMKNEISYQHPQYFNLAL